MRSAGVSAGRVDHHQHVVPRRPRTGQVVGEAGPGAVGGVVVGREGEPAAQGVVGFVDDDRGGAGGGGEADVVARRRRAPAASRSGSGHQLLGAEHQRALVRRTRHRRGPRPARAAPRPSAAWSRGGEPVPPARPAATRRPPAGRRSVQRAPLDPRLLAPACGPVAGATRRRDGSGARGSAAARAAAPLGRRARRGRQLGAQRRGALARSTAGQPPGPARRRRPRTPVGQLGRAGARRSTSAATT